MARTGSRRRAQRPVDLTHTLERLALLLGDRIGTGIARALLVPGGAPIAAAARPRAAKAPSVRRGCTREGCSRAAAAKGLCKSHYNLMLYHRRKAERVGPRAKP